MAKKKKPEPQVDKQEELKPAVIEAKFLEPCGHTNRHSQDLLTCLLPKGHPGNHFNGSAWSDAAGTPPRRHA